MVRRQDGVDGLLVPIEDHQAFLAACDLAHQDEKDLAEKLVEGSESDAEGTGLSAATVVDA